MRNLIATCKSFRNQLDTFVSNGFFALFNFPEEILRKIGELTTAEATRNLIATCKHIRNQPNTWFLQPLASESNPDRATSGFIVDAIEGKATRAYGATQSFL